MIIDNWEPLGRMSAIIDNNVLLAIGRDQPTKRTLGWNIDATDWDGGLICGNYLLHTDNPSG